MHEGNILTQMRPQGESRQLVVQARNLIATFVRDNERVVA